VLCANCHERADRDWDEATLKEYKKTPWVLRQHHPQVAADDSAIDDSATIELIINQDFESYSEADQQRLITAIRHLLGTEVPLIIGKKRHGSVKLSVNLPVEAAGRLFWAVKQGEFEEHDVTDADMTYKPLVDLPALRLEVTRAAAQIAEIRRKILSEDKLIKRTARALELYLFEPAATRQSLEEFGATLAYIDGRDKPYGRDEVRYRLAKVLRAFRLATTQWIEENAPALAKIGVDTPAILNRPDSFWQLLIPAA
ncbi:unnamed protein product, partial [marine sediment metagenome]